MENSEDDLYDYVYNSTRFKDKEDKKDFVVLFKVGKPSERVFVTIIEGYKIPYSYELIDGEQLSEYTFPIDCYDLIRVIINMRALTAFKII